jgi:hypothetical protein
MSQVFCFVFFRVIICVNPRDLRERNSKRRVSCTTAFNMKPSDFFPQISQINADKNADFFLRFRLENRFFLHTSQLYLEVFRGFRHPFSALSICGNPRDLRERNSKRRV